jgi:hypothetical protein
MRGKTVSEALRARIIHAVFSAFRIIAALAFKRCSSWLAFAGLG